MGEPFAGTAPSVGLPEDRLDSWKEIAAYLNRDVTTVQRWEKREGMTGSSRSRLPHSRLRHLAGWP